MAVIEISYYKGCGALIRRRGIPYRSNVSQCYIAKSQTMPTDHYIEHFLEPLVQKQYTYVKHQTLKPYTIRLVKYDVTPRIPACQ